MRKRIAHAVLSLHVTLSARQTKPAKRLISVGLTRGTVHERAAQIVFSFGVSGNRRLSEEFERPMRVARDALALEIHLAQQMLACRMIFFNGFFKPLERRAVIGA